MKITVTKDSITVDGENMYIRIPDGVTCLTVDGDVGNITVKNFHFDCTFAWMQWVPHWLIRTVWWGYDFKRGFLWGLR